MTLQSLRDKVAALSHLHPLTPVGIDDLRADAGCVCAEVDMSDAEFDRDEARADCERETTRANEAERIANDLRNELATANALLDEVKDQRRGPTLRKYRDQAEQADLRADGWKKAYNAMDAELTALRKRKGMLAALYAHKSDVIALLRDAQAGQAIDSAKAKELCQKIAADSK